MLHELLDFFGKAICHQLEERSLQISGETLSVCARDTGIYIGIFSSLTYLHLSKRNKKITIPTIKVSLLLLLLMVPMMIDGLGSYLHLFESDNIKRLVSGTSFGLVLPYFLYPLLSSKSLEVDSEPCLTERKDFLVPLLVSLVLCVIIYSGVISYYLVDSFIILMIIVWFSLFTFKLFPSVSNFRVKSIFSILVGLGVLALLSLLHSLLFS
ncbi:putative membrane protein [Bacillus sp. SORGH_AS 510]|uniref:DUF2085 domain-containing protein n=1 Tax=Bacillus sp. SORGH_AS_0510 TaxID=3041771 RepID=UPI0027866502|nr:DUF2085 domain-containing protein [Bacillus sp. SORGH_AS_0510]MDQ1144435.1 putative membrane protein [Bacillus sp. SORGH_AS_0510]